MLIIETYLGSSKGIGIGLFSKNDLTKGEIWWIRNEYFDKIFLAADIKRFGSISFQFIKTYGFLECTGNWYLCIDNAKFSNHSNDPNTSCIFTKSGELASCCTRRDIKAGEEILCNYQEFCIEAANRLGFSFE